MSERVKKTKWGGVLREKFEGGGGMPDRVKKMKCGGMRVKIGWGRGGGRSHKKI